MARNETDNPNTMNFNKNSVFSLKSMDINDVHNMIPEMLIPGEEILSAFRTVRDQIVFTNKRIIALNVQGIGKRKQFTSFPYKNIQFFNVQTPGLMEIVSDAELTLYFTNGFTAVYEFKGNVNLGELVRTISPYTL